MKKITRFLIASLIALSATAIFAGKAEPDRCADAYKKCSGELKKAAAQGNALAKSCKKSSAPACTKARTTFEAYRKSLNEACDMDMNYMAGCPPLK